MRARVPEGTLETFRTMALGLKAMHTRGGIHRDLKPSNVLILPNGDPVIIDFGVAWSEEFSPMTRSQGIFGTLQYWRRRAYDVHALGVLLYEALTGSHPYPIHEEDPIGVLTARALETRARGVGRPGRAGDAAARKGSPKRPSAHADHVHAARRRQLVADGGDHFLLGADQPGD
jgi:serine/threonine protein kinase